MTMLNTNTIHNILNLLQLVVGALLTFDWTTLGADPKTATAIAGIIVLLSNVIKLTMNMTRDGGPQGLIKKQPPVQ